MCYFGVMATTKISTLKRTAKPAIVLLLLLGIALFLKIYPEELKSLTFNGQIPTWEILQTSILLALVWLLAGLLEIFLWEGLVEKRLESKVPKLLKTILNATLFIIVIIIAVGFIFKQSVTGLVATTGAMGIVLGLGLKSTLESAFNGVTLSVDRVFQIGDIVTIRNTFDTPAKVVEITWRYTLFEDSSGNHVVVPNNTICAAIITNYSRPSQNTCVSFFMTFCLPASSVVRIKRKLDAAIRSTKIILADPPPTILIADINDGCIKCQLNYWINFNKVKPEEARNELYKNIILHLSVAGIGLEITSSRNREQVFIEQKPEDMLANILLQVELFSQFSKEEIAALGSQVVTLNLPPNEVIIKQGESGESMYVLAEGLLKVDIEDPESKKVFTVAKILPGQFFGEMSLLVGDPRSATITTMTESVVYEINKATMQHLFEAHPNLIQLLSNKIAERHVYNLRKKQALLEKDITANTQSYSDMFCGMIKKWFGTK